MKRSPHSDPGPGHDPNGSTQTTSSTKPDSSPQQQQQQQTLDIDQWTLVLDTIRANLNLIVSTWGRGSRQYDEARGVMLAYLEENLGRLRGQHQGGGGGDEVENNQGRDRNGDGDVPMDAVEKGIEELMGELRI